jgi:hypothetical protein
MTAQRDARSGPRIAVSPAFFSELVKVCERHLDHLVDEADEHGPAEHLERQDLPEWIRRLSSDVDFDARVGNDEAVGVCAKLLGISPATAYAKLPKSMKPGSASSQ